MSIKYALVFPGQGSQYMGMLKDYYDTYPNFKKIFDTAGHILGYDLWSIIMNHENNLAKTEVTQPALLTSSYGIFSVLLQQGTLIKKNIAVMSGHSLGEFSALVCAGYIDFKDALLLVADRGKYMHQYAGKGSMLAVLGGDDIIQLVIDYVRDQGQYIAVANYNSKGQIVLAGTIQGIECVQKYCRLKFPRVKLRHIPVTIASHCDLMRDAATEFRKRIHHVPMRIAAIPVVGNVDAQVYSSVADLKDALVRQMYNSIRWTNVIDLMYNRFLVDYFLEIGPSGILTSLMRRISNKYRGYKSDPLSAVKSIGL